MNMKKFEEYLQEKGIDTNCISKEEFDLMRMYYNGIRYYQQQAQKFVIKRNEQYDYKNAISKITCFESLLEYKIGEILKREVGIPNEDNINEYLNKKR